MWFGITIFKECITYFASRTSYELDPQINEKSHTDSYLQNKSVVIAQTSILIDLLKWSI